MPRRLPPDQGCNGKAGLAFWRVCTCVLQTGRVAVHRKRVELVIVRAAGAELHERTAVRQGCNEQWPDSCPCNRTSLTPSGVLDRVRGFRLSWGTARLKSAQACSVPDAGWQVGKRNGVRPVVSRSLGHRRGPLSRSSGNRVVCFGRVQDPELRRGASALRLSHVGSACESKREGAALQGVRQSESDRSGAVTGSRTSIRSSASAYLSSACKAGSYAYPL